MDGGDSILEGKRGRRRSRRAAIARLAPGAINAGLARSMPAGIVRSSY
jgi:hypothetical protein